jgi:hypothetical protein
MCASMNDVPFHSIHFYCSTYWFIFVVNFSSSKNHTTNILQDKFTWNDHAMNYYYGSVFITRQLFHLLPTLLCMIRIEYKWISSNSTKGGSDWMWKDERCWMTLNDITQGTCMNEIKHNLTGFDWKHTWLDWL